MTQVTFDQIMLVVNMMVAIRAVHHVARARRASRGQIPARTSWLLLLTAAFASLYCLSYVIILTVGPEYRLAWSRIMITISPFVWWFVWPALADTVIDFKDAQTKIHTELSPKLDAAQRSTLELVRKVDNVA